MKLAIVVNDVATERGAYATTRIALAAAARDHQVWYVNVDGLGCDAEGRLPAQAWAARSDAGGDHEAFIDGIRDAGPQEQRLDLRTVDVLLLRNDPADDLSERPWAQTVGVTFGDLAARHGVMVLNNPTGLFRALNKLYFQQYPAAVRPETLVTRDAAAIRRFVAEHDGRAVLKPLQGSGGHGVFVVQAQESPNLNQMIDAILRDGYVVAQEFLPAAADGAARLFLVDGAPLEVEGRYAAFLRVNPTEDPRSNMEAGGRPVAVEVDATMLDIAEQVRPKLLEDGMFLVGLDIVGDKLLEVNVFSAGGLTSANQLNDRDFATAIVEAIERKASLPR